MVFSDLTIMFFPLLAPEGTVSMVPCKFSEGFCISKNKPENPSSVLLPPCAAICVKILSIFSDNVYRRNYMIVKFLVLGISIIYGVLLALYYSG